jgi:hypothetical protein
MNPSCIKELANLAQPGGEAFHDALIPLQIGGQERNSASVFFSNSLTFTKPLAPLSRHRK